MSLLRRPRDLTPTGTAVNRVGELEGRVVTGYTVDGEGLTIHFNGGYRINIKQIPPDVALQLEATAFVAILHTPEG